MIDPQAQITYSQYNEDIILQVLLYDVEKGFYVDVGANDPVIDSVTKKFYDSGWTGINIEPIQSLYKKLTEARPKDANINCGAGAEAGKLTFREYNDVPGHSTFDKPEQLQNAGEVNFTDYAVEVVPLKTILQKYKAHHIHFLKVDVEGFEYEVVAGNDWSEYRPEIICIESNHVKKDWRKILTDNDFVLFISDGLNEYYIAKESWARTEGFVERIVVADYRTLKLHQYRSWKSDSEELSKLHKRISVYEERVKTLTDEVEYSSKHVIRSLPFMKWLLQNLRGAKKDSWHNKK